MLNAIKTLPEVCLIYCATANPLQAFIGQTEQGRGTMGEIDGAAPVGIEGEDGVAWRKDLLRTIDFKL